MHYYFMYSFHVQDEYYSGLMESALDVFPLMSQFLHGEGWWCCLSFELINGANVLYNLFKKKKEGIPILVWIRCWMVKRISFFVCLVLLNFVQAHFSSLSGKKK